MPIFQESEKSLRFRPWDSTLPQHDVAKRKCSEESIRTEFCDGPEPEGLEWNRMDEAERGPESSTAAGTRTSDRAELIERIKRGESPTWVPKQAVCDSRRMPLDI